VAQFQTIVHDIISRGMDTRSAIKNIKQGFSTLIKNMDTNSAGFLEKRKGYEGHVGYVPLRVVEVKRDINGGIEFIFDGSLSFSGVESSPILGKGTLWNTNQDQRILDNVTDGVLTFDGPSATPPSFDTDNIQVGTPIALFDPTPVTGGWTVHAVTSLSPVTVDNGDVDLDIAGPGVLYALLEEQEVYWDSFINNIYKEIESGVPQVYVKPDDSLDELVGAALKLSTTQYELVETDVTTMDVAEISHTITTPFSGLTLASYFVDRSQSYVQYTHTENVPATNFFTIDILQSEHNLPNKNIVSQIWKDLGGGQYERVEADLFIFPNGDIQIKGEKDFTDSYDLRIVLYDIGPSNVEIIGVSGTEEMLSVEIPTDSEFVFVQPYLLQNGTVGDSPYSGPFEGLIGQEAVKVDSILIEDNIATINIDLPDGVGSSDLKIVYLKGKTGAPSITVDPTQTGVDDATPQFCIYGIDPADVVFENDSGVINSLEEYSSIARSDVVVGMGGNLFVESSDFVLPSTRVDIRGTSDFDSTTQTVSPLFVDKSINTITPSGTQFTVALSEATDLTDPDILSHYVSITNTSNSEYTGVFKIVSVDDVLNTITVETNVTLNTKVETDTAGSLSIDTFILKLEDTVGHSFQVGDQIVSNQFPETTPIVREILNEGTPNVALLIGDIPSSRPIFPGVILTGQRTSNVINTPISQSLFVKGDMLSLAGYERKFRVVDISLSTDFASMTLDESILVKDSTLSTEVTTVSLLSRWSCIEYPDLNQRTTKHFSSEYDQQKRLQAARINDSIFYTDYTGEVLKYDGASIYAAGLVPWMPQVTSYADIDPSEERIIIKDYTCTVQESAVGSVTLQFENSDIFSELTVDSQIYVHGVTTSLDSHRAWEILDIDSAAAIPTITISRNTWTPADDDPATISIVQYVQYYFKLQAYDRNNNIVASAVTDYRDTTVRLMKSGKVYHRLTRPPQFKAYEYDRLDIEMYRTKLAQTVVPEFFKVRTLSLDYSSHEPVIDILLTDSTGNNSLERDPDDLVSNAISLQTVGNALERPLSYEPPQRSKYIDSVANRLVQANIQGPNEIELRLEPSDDESSVGLTVDINQYTFANPTTVVYNIDAVEITQEGREITVTLDSPHGIASPEGKWTQLYQHGGDNEELKQIGPAIGWWKIKSASGSTVVLESAYIDNQGMSPAINVATEGVSLRVGASNRVPVVSVFPNTPENYDSTRIVDTETHMISFIKKLQQAINTVAAKDSEFKVYSQQGSKIGFNTLKLTSSSFEEDLEIVVDTSVVVADIDIDIFANGVRKNSGESIAGVSKIFPSRLTVSPEKFPETFDNPLADNAIYSNAIVDVNADDGEEITGTKSFLAIASSSNSQVQSTLIVTKSSSVYAIDVVTREQTKLESSGQGCTIPDSLAATSDGIMFANESGIYVVTPNLQVKYVGKYMEGYWESEINSASLTTEPYGFTDSLNRKYRLSIPSATSTRNDEVINYDYIKEESDEGAWFLYESVAASNWLQTSTETYFGNYSCRVFRARNTGESSDYRDDDQAITSVVEYSPRSFGDSGEEVLLDSFITHIEEGSSIKVSEALDMSNSYTELDPINNDQSVKSFAVKSTVTSPSVLFLQVRYEHKVKDEGFKLSGIDFRVAPTNAEKVPDAGK